MQSITRILFHLLPFLPLAFGFNWLAVATVLLVLVSYVKVKKLELQLAELAQRRADPVDIASVRKACNFWRGLTFLRDNTDRAGE